MYKSFYKLTRNPFDLTPDPACFVPTARHNEALAALYYGIRRHKGVVVVTGEVGTGKTLLLRCLLQLFKENKEISYAYIFNCRFSAIEFLHYTASDFGLQVSGQNKSELLIELSKYVTSRGLNGSTTVLIVDEAHNLSMELLEEIRLLSNLETNDDKMLQILLVGQPELDEKLDSFELRPLKQRIALRAQLEPLNARETQKYIQERLAISGRPTQLGDVFSPEAVTAVYEFSRGLPRLINTICENALINGYASQMEVIPAEVIKGVAQDFHLIGDGRAGRTGQGDPDSLDLEQAKGFFLELYSGMKRPSGSDSDLQTPIAVEAGEHEPDI
jgi:general secretion pathway protein A